MSSEGDVETALIGIVPAKVLRKDLDVLLENAAAVAEGKSSDNGEGSAKRELPYTMFDAFRARPEDRRVKF